MTIDKTLFIIRLVMRRRIILLLICVGIAPVLLFAAAIVAIRPPPIWWYKNSVSQDLAHFRNAPLLNDDAWRKNLYVPRDAKLMAISNESTTELPIFRREDDVFIYLWKGMSESIGMAVSADPEFIPKTERLESILHIEHVDGLLYKWHFDGEGGDNEHYQYAR